MRRVTWLIGVALLLGVAARDVRAGDPPAAAPVLDAKTAAAVDAAVEAERSKQCAVGVALGVIRDGRVAYVKGYGFADRDRKTPVTEKTVFNWASNSKPLAAALAMQLVEKKLLDLDADVRKYVPEWPEKDAVVTCRKILCHQSGIPHYGPDIVGTPKTHKGDLPFLDPVVALERFDKSRLLFQPGEKTHYSTFAFILLSAVVQRAGKAPFLEQLQERVAKPLGLATLQYDVPTKGQAEWSTGYLRRGESVAVAPEDAHYWKHGGGGFKSDVGDFARWAAALMDRKLLSEETETAMWTRQTTNDGKGTAWGLGVNVSGSGGSLYVSHGGKQPEATSCLQVRPSTREGVVVLCNCDFGEPSAIAKAVWNALRAR
jgi:CubicO group peptidase (beta-lactamase class C family)